MARVDVQTTFVANSEDVNTQTVADYLPNGELFRAKNIEGSTLRTLLYAFSAELTRVESKLQELVDEYYIEDTYNLIDFWESIVSIPDECFSIQNKTIEERRKQVIAKYALMNLTTTVDFVDLAAYFGVRVEIFNGHDISSFFPMTFPILFFNSVKEAKFTMVVHFPDFKQPKSVFPLTFPVTFDENPDQFILCLFNKLKPVNVKVVVRYEDDLEFGAYLLETDSFLLLETEDKIILE